jgi:hypothetical protein
MCSAIRNLPLILGTLVAALASGLLATATLFYSPMAVLATALMSVGAGLLTTLDPDADASKWIGYQALFGLGIGTGTQLPILAIQANVDGECRRQANLESFHKSTLLTKILR